MAAPKKVHHHSVIIQFLDRCSDPGIDRGWNRFWELKDGQAMLRHRLSGKDNTHGPLGYRLRESHNNRHVEAMDFFQRAPGDDRNQFDPDEFAEIDSE